MANLKNFNKSQIGAMVAHFNRHKSCPTPVRYGNINIDQSRTHLNYNLCEREDSELSDYDYIIKHAEPFMAQKKKNTTYMSCWVVTLPTGLKNASEEEQKRFFEEVYQFNKSRYPDSKPVSAWVHMDESSPHMHYSFIPIGKNKKGELTCAARNCANQKDVRSYHKDLSEHMRKVFGHDIGVYLNQEGQEKASKSYKTQAEYKQANKALRDENSSLGGENFFITLELEEQRAGLAEIKEELEFQRLKRNQQAKSLDFLERQVSDKNDEIKSLNNQVLELNTQLGFKSQKLSELESDLKRLTEMAYALVGKYKSLDSYPLDRQLQKTVVSVEQQISNARKKLDEDRAKKKPKNRKKDDILR